MSSFPTLLTDRTGAPNIMNAAKNLYYFCFIICVETNKIFKDKVSQELNCEVQCMQIRKDVSVTDVDIVGALRKNSVSIFPHFAFMLNPPFSISRIQNIKCRN